MVAWGQNGGDEASERDETPEEKSESAEGEHTTNPLLSSLELSDTQSLRALNTSPPRNRCTGLVINQFSRQNGGDEASERDETPHPEGEHTPCETINIKDQVFLA